jgi:hypothetical protein
LTTVDVGGSSQRSRRRGVSGGRAV